MKELSPFDQLQESIRLLEIKQTNEEALLKEQFKATYESLKPISLIKSTLDELTSLPDYNGNILGTSLSLIAGYFSKKILFGSTLNPFKQIFGSLIQMVITNMVSKNSPDIKSLISQLVNSFLDKNKSDKEEA